MILKDEAYKLGVLEMWHFRIECDKCKAVASVSMNTREMTQRFIFNAGWRMSPRARKYVHKCKGCLSKGAPKGQ